MHYEFCRSSDESLQTQECSRYTHVAQIVFTLAALIDLQFDYVYYI